MLAECWRHRGPLGEVRAVGGAAHGVAPKYRPGNGPTMRKLRPCVRLWMHRVAQVHGSRRGDDGRPGPLDEGSDRCGQRPAATDPRRGPPIILARWPSPPVGPSSSWRWRDA